MSAVSQIERGLKDIVIDKCWSYLNDNFHKLTETNKIKVAMALCTKSIPQKFDGDLRQTVVMGEITRDGEPLRFDIGEPYTPEIIRRPGEAPSRN